MPLIQFANFPFVNDRLQKAVGKLALTWNQATYIVYAMFVGFSGMPAPLAAKAFYSLKADSAQRDMTRAMAEHILLQAGTESDRALLNRIIKCFDSVQKFAAVRNGAIHGTVVFDKFGIIAIDPRNPARENQRKHDLFKDPEAVQSELNALISELADVANASAVHLAWADTLLKS